MLVYVLLDLVLLDASQSHNYVGEIVQYWVVELLPSHCEQPT